MRTTARVRKTVLGGAAVLAFVLGGAALSSALHRFTPRYLQVTNHASGTIGRTATRLGSTWIFEGSGDIVGNCNVNPQLFLFDLVLRVLGGAPGLSQITFGSFNPSYPSLSKFENWYAFDADGALCSLAANRCDAQAFSTSGRQIFLFERATKRMRQVTRGPGDAVNAYLSGNGRSIVFESMTDYLGTGLVGTTPEIYQGDLTRLGPACPQLPCPAAGFGFDRGLRRVTNGGGTHPVQNFNGGRIVFESRGDLVHGGANPGVQHIYMIDNNGLLQVTQGTTDSRYPDVNLNARTIAYEKDVDGVSQIFASRIKTVKIVTRQFTRATNGSVRPSIDQKGRHLSYKSFDDLLGNGTPPGQIFAYNLRRNILTQITGGPNGGDFPESTVGPIVSFATSDDVVGNENTVPQLFMSNFFRNAPIQLRSPFPGTPTPRPTPIATPVAGIPHSMQLSLLTDQSAPNGNSTLTTFIAAVVRDFQGNPVPDGLLVDFAIAEPNNGAIISDGLTNTDPACDPTSFEQVTGYQVVNQPGVAHGCITYPGAEATTTRTITATAGLLSGSGDFVLPPAPNDCASTFVGSPCTDHNPCTTSDVCTSIDPPTCAGTAVTCSDDGNPCSIDTCNVISGLCNQPVVCANDGNPCTDDVCDTGTGACGIPNTAQCEDGDLCTTGSVCGGGVCQPGTLVTCPDDANPCTEDICDAGTGNCGVPIEPCVCPTPGP